MYNSFNELMRYDSPFGDTSIFNDEDNEDLKEIETDKLIHQTLVGNKFNSANGFYYLYDGTFLGRYDTSEEVVVCKEFIIVPISKNNKKEYKKFTLPQRLKMTNAELNTRAFMSTFRAAENFSAGKPTEYNFLYGKKEDGGGTFTDLTYAEKPEDYKDHPRKFIVSWGNKQAQSPAGAYQINVLTWDDIKDKAGVTDFSPKSQDAFAKYLIYQRAEFEIKTGDVERAIEKLNGRWSSLPGGKHQQINMTKAIELFKKYLNRELNGISIIETPVGELN